MNQSTTPSIQKAKTALKHGDQQMAVHWTQQALLENPQDILALSILAGISQNPQESVQYLNRILQLDPTNQQAKEGLEWAKNKAEKSGQQIDMHAVHEEKPAHEAPSVTGPVPPPEKPRPQESPVSYPPPPIQTQESPASHPLPPRPQESPVSHPLPPRPQESPVSYPLPPRPQESPASHPLPPRPQESPASHPLPPRAQKTTSKKHNRNPEFLFGLVILPWVVACGILIAALITWLGGFSALKDLGKNSLPLPFKITLAPVDETAIYETVIAIQSTQRAASFETAQTAEMLIPTATLTPTPLPSSTPLPTATPTPLPTQTPMVVTPSAEETKPSGQVTNPATGDHLPTSVPIVQITPISAYSPLPPVQTNNTIIVPNPNPVIQEPASVTAPTGDFWVDINLSQQMVYAYSGNTLLNSFVASTGTAEHPTVTGQYRIYVMYRYADMRGPGYDLPNVPYVMYFYQGYGLHGTYWHSNFGTPMSHGCINLSTSDAQWIYEQARVGTIVNIHY